MSAFTLREMCCILYCNCQCFSFAVIGTVLKKDAGLNWTIWNKLKLNKKFWKIEDSLKEGYFEILNKQSAWNSSSVCKVYVCMWEQGLFKTTDYVTVSKYRLPPWDRLIYHILFSCNIKVTNWIFTTAVVIWFSKDRVEPKWGVKWGSERPSNCRAVWEEHGRGGHQGWHAPSLRDFVAPRELTGQQKRQGTGESQRVEWGRKTDISPVLF